MFRRTGRDFRAGKKNFGVIGFGVVPKWLRELSAKQLFTGSNPVHASTKFFDKKNLVDTQANVAQRQAAQ